MRGRADVFFIDEEKILNARRELIVGGAAVAAGLALGLPVLAQPAPAGKLKVAAVYTVPF